MMRIQIQLEKHIWELFKGEIQRNCDFALLAYEDMIYRSQVNTTSDKTFLDRLWMSVVSFLIAVANISKILWPSQPPKCQQCNYQPLLEPEVSLCRTQLRAILHIDEDSPLGKRSFRNFFEHYDFQLQDWIKEVNNREVFDSNIGPIESVIKGSDKSRLIIRQFDQHKRIIYFRNREYHIIPVVDALKELKVKTEKVSLGQIRISFFCPGFD